MKQKQLNKRFHKLLRALDDAGLRIIPRDELEKDPKTREYAGLRFVGSKTNRRLKMPDFDNVIVHYVEGTKPLTVAGVVTHYLTMARSAGGSNRYAFSVSQDAFAVVGGVR